jgi:hypothetical protein
MKKAWHKTALHTGVFTLLTAIPTAISFFIFTIFLFLGLIIAPVYLATYMFIGELLPDTISDFTVLFLLPALGIILNFLYNFTLVYFVKRKLIIAVIHIVVIVLVVTLLGDMAAPY